MKSKSFRLLLGMAPEVKWEELEIKTENVPFYKTTQSMESSRISLLGWFGPAAVTSMDGLLDRK